MKKRIGIVGAAAMALLWSGSAEATVFSFDEFYIERGATTGTRTEIFRDSFNDGTLPPSGPDDGITTSGDTYTVFGNGFVSENASSNGRLLVDSELGGYAINPTGADRLFNRARRQISTNPSGSQTLTEASSFSVNALLDLTILPANPGEAFGLRLEDNSGGNPNAGNDRIALEVRRSNTSGNLGVSFNGLDFFGVPIENFGFVLLQPLLDTYTAADQILLSMTKDENTKLLGAEFSLLSGGSALYTQSLDTLGDTSGVNAQLFSDELFTRAAITTIQRAPIPEPGTIAVLCAGLVGLYGVRRRQRRSLSLAA